MEYSNDENKQTVKPLTAVFFAGVVLNLCFIFPILRHCEKTVFAQTGKINPNAALTSELAELPGLGPAKAQAIVEYRQGIRRRHPSSSLKGTTTRLNPSSLRATNGQEGYGGQEEKAFENAGDLEKVKGIGEKTVEKIKEWLEFNND
jgi:hypothetical protein